MAPITHLYHHINDITGFAQGDTFDSAAQVREYFTRENLWDMVGHAQFIDEEGHDLTPSQEELDKWAETVIENHWHCADAFAA